jgi:hypothetical protein
MKSLYNIKPSRLFTFGCSFTSYRWATWANILALDLDCEFYNLGKAGSGNFYIANTISQADEIYKFTPNDLVIISWTNISREDRWISQQGWCSPGNIYSQDVYDKKFLKRWANETHFALRDFSSIKLIDEFLKDRTQYHFLSICNISKRLNQYADTENIDDDFKKVSSLYRNTLNKILPSFYEILWNNDLNYKIKLDEKIIHPKFFDGHPTIIEHLEYLQKSFDYNFKEETVKIVQEMHYKWIQYLKNNNIKYIHDLPSDKKNELEKMFKLKESLVPSNLLLL